MLGSLQNLFNQARQKVAAAENKSTNNAQAWLEKVFSVNPSLKRILPIITDDTYQAIYHGLYNGKLLEVIYKKTSAEEPRKYQLFPKALMIRGDSLHLIAGIKTYGIQQL
jgi:hypothetical protein